MMRWLGSIVIIAGTLHAARAQDVPPAAAPAVAAPAPLVERAVLVDRAANPPETRDIVQSLLLPELAFYRQACRLNAQQSEQLDQRIGQELDAFLPVFEKRQRQMLQVAGGVHVFNMVGNGEGVRELNESPQEMVRAWLWQVTASTIPDEQLALGRDELKQRDEFLRDAGVMQIVALLDAKLRLTSHQRQLLLTSLSKVWQPAWQGNLEVMVHNPELFPTIPDEAVIPYLTGGQVAQWNSFTKIGSVGMAQGWQQVRMVGPRGAGGVILEAGMVLMEGGEVVDDEEVDADSVPLPAAPPQPVAVPVEAAPAQEAPHDQP